MNFQSRENFSPTQVAAIALLMLVQWPTAAAPPKSKLVQRFFGQGDRSTQPFSLDGSTNYKFVAAARLPRPSSIGSLNLFYLYKEGDVQFQDPSAVDFEVRTLPGQQYSENFTFPQGLESGRYYFKISSSDLWEVRIFEIPDETDEIAEKKPPMRRGGSKKAGENRNFVGTWKAQTIFVGTAVNEVLTLADDGTGTIKFVVLRPQNAFQKNGINKTVQWFEDDEGIVTIKAPGLFDIKLPTFPDLDPPLYGYRLLKFDDDGTLRGADIFSEADNIEVEQPKFVFRYRKSL